MNFLRAAAGDPTATLVYRMNRRERALLLQTLRLFPVLSSSFNHLTRDIKKSPPAEQRLLEESMTHLRAESRRRLDEFLNAQATYFTEAGDDVRLRLSSEQVEWLMRVLNDIRVGSWVQLGCPDPAAGEYIKPSARNPHALAAMELSGYFQACLLQAFS